MQNRHQIELTWLEDCLALAETLNFSRAATLRYVTQPAFSRRIQSLEAWVGTALFERSRRGVQLTRAGKAFCVQASTLTRSLYAARDEALEIAGLGTPTLIFSATHALSFTFFPDWMRQHEQAIRLGSFQLLSDTLRGSERMLMQGRSQFLLCHYHPRISLNLDLSQFHSLVVGVDQLIPLSAPRGDSTDPKWPVKPNGPRYPILGYSDDSGLGRILAAHMPLDKIRKRGDAVFISDLAATLLAMVRAGDGVAWLPKTLAQHDIANGSMVAAAPETPAFSVPVEIRLFRPVDKMSLAAEALWQIFIDQVGVGAIPAQDV